VSNLRIRSGEQPSVRDVALDPELGKAIKDAQAEMERLIRLGEQQNDPIRHPIQALSVHLDALLKLSTSTVRRLPGRVAVRRLPTNRSTTSADAFWVAAKRGREAWCAARYGKAGRRSRQRC
jgi:hypothetical protein